MHEGHGSHVYPRLQQVGLYRQHLLRARRAARVPDGLRLGRREWHAALGPRCDIYGTGSGIAMVKLW